MTTWTTPADVIDRWVGDNKPTDEALVQLWINDAEEMIRFEFPDIDARIVEEPGALEEGQVPLARVVLVVKEMVTRALRNPAKIRQEGIGPFNTTYGAETLRGLELTDAERQMLSGHPGAPRQKAFTINTTPAGSPLHPLAGAMVNGPDGQAPGEG